MDEKKFKIPGTSLGIGGVIGAAGFVAGGIVGGLLSPILGFGAGLLLSQITKVADDLTKETIQNWVKRGFVDSPRNGKFYDEDQVARIFIINSLRNVINLENIKVLLQYVNGDLTDKSDDIISEKALLEIFNAAIIKTSNIYPGDLSGYEKVIDEEILNYIERREGDRVKLKNTLVTMVTAYHSSLLKKQADGLIENMKNQITLRKDD